MSKAQLDKYFNDYVFGFMFTDIRREIDHGRAHLAGTSIDGGGNFLAALGYPAAFVASEERLDAGDLGGAPQLPALTGAAECVKFPSSPLWRS